MSAFSAGPCDEQAETEGTFGALCWLVTDRLSCLGSFKHFQKTEGNPLFCNAELVYYLTSRRKNVSLCFRVKRAFKINGEFAARREGRGERNESVSLVLGKEFFSLLIRGVIKHVKRKQRQLILLDNPLGAEIALPSSRCENQRNQRETEEEKVFVHGRENSPFPQFQIGDSLLFLFSFLSFLFFLFRRAPLKFHLFAAARNCVASRHGNSNFNFHRFVFRPRLRSFAGAKAFHREILPSKFSAVSRERGVGAVGKGCVCVRVCMVPTTQFPSPRTVLRFGTSFCTPAWIYTKPRS